jgi:hypothetical protein
MKTNKHLTFLLVLLVMLVVCMTLFSPIPATSKLIIRIVLLALFFALWRWFHKKDQTDLKNLAFAFMALNLASPRSSGTSSLILHKDLHSLNSATLSLLVEY